MKIFEYEAVYSDKLPGEETKTVNHKLSYFGSDGYRLIQVVEIGELYMYILEKESYIEGES